MSRTGQKGYNEADAVDGTISAGTGVTAREER